VTPFRLLLPGVVALAAYRPLATALLRQGRPMVATAFGLAALVGNVVANSVLLPSIGLVGASLSSSITYLGLAIAYLAVLRSAEVTWRDLVPRWSDVRAVRDSLRAPRG
jgi:O-antigen/teichoic acid export membrane protein